MSKNETPSQRILKWLRQNKIPLGALTSHDAAALHAATEIANLWVRGDTNNKPKAAQAFRLVVEQMQPTTSFMAFHAIAMVGDWPHRYELWILSGLPQDLLQHAPECAFGPKR